MPLPKSIGEVIRIEVAVIGPRNFPIATAKIAHNYVGDLPDIVRYAQKMRPHLSPEDVIRSIWRTGCDQIARGFKQSALPQTPAVKPVPEPDERVYASSDPSGH